MRDEPQESVGGLILLQIVLASRKLVRTWIAKQLFKSSRVCVREEQRSRPKRCANIERQAKSPQTPWTESWVGRARRKTGSAKIFRSWGRCGGKALRKQKLGHCSSLQETFLNDHLLKDLTICVCVSKSHFTTGHVNAECPFDPVSSYFLITYCLTDTTDWNQIKPLYDSARGWTVWSSGRFDPKHTISFRSKIAFNLFIFSSLKNNVGGSVSGPNSFFSQKNCSWKPKNNFKINIKVTYK